MSRFWRNDEEMAKKDDDLHAPRQTGQWQAARGPRRGFTTRIAIYVFVAFVTIFTLVRFIRSTPDVYVDAPYLHRSSLDSLSGYDRQSPSDRRPDTAKGRGSDESRTYNGPIRFPLLANSLHSISSTGGTLYKNRNVLFAAASLASASTLLPMACQMAEERESYVHFALLSRNDVSMDDLLKINGIDSSCKLILHGMREIIK